jgi:hypothetical protein
MSIYMSEASCTGTGEWPEAIAKVKHIAGDIAIIRCSGGRHVWMPTSASSVVGPGTRLLVAGGGLPLAGMENLGIERAVLVAGQDSLFNQEKVEVDTDGLPLCPNCRRGLTYHDSDTDADSDTETMSGLSVERLNCLECGDEFELVNDPVDGNRLHPVANTKRGRSRKRVSVGAVELPVGVGAAPGVAMARAGNGIEIVLVNPTSESAAGVEDALVGFGESVQHAGDGWVIDMNSPFAGEVGPAYVSLVKLHRLISQRGVPPGLFRDLRDWVAGRS